MRFRDVWFVPFGVAICVFLLDYYMHGKDVWASMDEALGWLAGGLTTITIICDLDRKKKEGV